MQSLSASITETKSDLYSQLINTVGPLTIPPDTAKKITPKVEKIPVSVTAEKGSYFDANTGIMVYQSNVEVTHPKYNLSCSDELKITLKEKAVGDEIEGENNTPSTPSSNKINSPKPKKLAKFDSLSKAIATGNVVINAKDKDGENIVTHSDIATYDSETGIIMLKGGKPTIQQGDKLLTILTDAGYILIFPDMSFQIKGKHKITANLKEPQNK
jgi:lipopolysaccharide export system protein LptA